MSNIENAANMSISYGDDNTSNVIKNLLLATDVIFCGASRVTAVADKKKKNQNLDAKNQKKKKKTVL